MKNKCFTVPMVQDLYNHINIDKRNEQWIADWLNENVEQYVCDYFIKIIAEKLPELKKLNTSNADDYGVNVTLIEKIIL